MKLQIIQLEAYDDVASVRDRLAFVKAERVLLVWPRGATILNRKLDLVLIQREAARRGLWLALVTRTPEIIDLAAELNLSTFASVRASQRSGWTKPRSKVFVARADRPDNSPDPYVLMLHASRLRALSPAQRNLRRGLRWAAIAALILTVVSLSYLLVPGAEVLLTPARGQIDTALPLIADPNARLIDVESGRIPAVLQTQDVTAEASIRPTGLTDVPSAFASGEVLFTNRIESPVTIPAGTVVMTAGRRAARFRTLAEAELAAGVGQEATVAVQALDDTPGTAGNVAPNLINIVEGDLSGLVFVRNPEATRGGLVREQAVVRQADYDNLLILGRAQLKQIALARFSAALGGTQIVVPDSLRILNEGSEEATYSAFVGDPVDQLTLTIRARLQALIIDEQAAHQVALARLSQEIPAGQRLLLETITYTRGPMGTADAQGRVIFLMSASGGVAAAIDTERARQRIAGQSLEAALETLNRDWLLDPRRPPQIQVWPGVFGRLPVLPLRIQIQVMSQ